MSLLPGAGGARTAFWAVLVAALLLRVWLAAEVVTQGTGLHDRPPLDPWLYHAEAQLVLEGDVLLRGAFGLLEEAGLAGAATYFLTPEGKRTYHRLYGREPLVHAPLYPWLLAPTLAASPNGDLMRLLQIFATLVVAWGVFALARACSTDDATAVLAMGLFAFHPTTLLYSAFLLKVTLITGLLVFLALSLALCAQRPSAGRAAGLGIILGVLHLSKGILLFALPLLALLAFRGRGSPARRAGLLGLVIVILLVALTPLVVRSQICGTSPLQNSSQSHLALIQFNFVGADGIHQVRPTPDYVHGLIEGRSGNLEVLLATIDTHPNLSSFAFLLARKLQAFFNGYEPRNNLSPQVHVHLFDSLRWLPTTTWLLLPFALVGLGGALRRWRHLWPALAVLGVVLVTCLAATSMARYRLPALPFLCLFAAVGIRRLWLGRRRPRRVGLHLVALLALAVACSPARLQHDDPSRPPIVASVPRHDALVGLAERYRGSPRLSPSLALRAIQEHPISHVSEPIEQLARRPGFKRYVVAHDWAYRLCMEVDARPEARAVLQSLQRLDPTSAVVRERLRALDDSGLRR